MYLDSGEVALVRSQNVYNDGFHHDGLVYLSDTHAAELENVALESDDVLLNITGDSVARCCQVDPDVLPARVNQHVAIIRPLSEVLDARYLRYYLIAPLMQAQMLSWAGAGGTRNALTKGMIESFDIEAPQDVGEQRAIAAVLGALDDKIEVNRKTAHALEGIARAVFESWFVRFDPVRRKAAGEPTGLPDEIAALFPDRMVESANGEAPEGWSIRTLRDLCEKPQYGLTASANVNAVGPKFLRITDINKQAWIDWSAVPHCELPTGADAARYRLRVGDLVIARMADPGHAALIEEERDAVFASYLIRFRPQTMETARYLQYWTRSAGYWDLVHGRKTGSTRATLNATELSELPLLVPGAPLVARFAAIVSTTRARGAHAIGQSASLAALRDALLPRLISGELRIDDAEQIVGRAV